MAKQAPHMTDPVDPFGIDPGDDGSLFLGTSTAPNGERTAVLMPRAVSKLQGEARLTYRYLQDAVMGLAEAQRRVDSAVGACRLHGISWNSIGWVLGITGQSTRERFGDDEPDL